MDLFDMFWILKLKGPFKIKMAAGAFPAAASQTRRYELRVFPLAPFFTAASHADKMPVSANRTSGTSLKLNSSPLGKCTRLGRRRAGLSSTPSPVLCAIDGVRFKLKLTFSEVELQHGCVHSSWTHGGETQPLCGWSIRLSV